MLIIYLKYITWISDNKIAWTLKAGGMGPDPLVNIAARPIPQEPMVRRVYHPILLYLDALGKIVSHCKPGDVN